ncbi:MAG: Fur family transcriptional regulator [Burkholderiaceae bacterium]
MTEDHTTRQRRQSRTQKTRPPAKDGVSKSLAQDLIRALNERVTRARVATLNALLDSPVALSHHEVLDRLDTAGETIDRVTVYRTLEWLVQVQLAHRVSSKSRAWHFSAHASGHHDEAHAHFECRACQRVYCIESASPPTSPSVPSGFKVEQAMLKLEGTCANCAGGRSEKKKRAVSADSGE